MTAQSVFPPFAVFADRSGEPLTGGYVYLGVAGANPITNPIQAYFDSGLTIPAAQPIRTSGGFPLNSGAPARLFVDASDFSLLVQNSSGQLVYSALRSALIAGPATSLEVARSAEEIAAGVTPITAGGFQVGDNRRYSSFADWVAVMSQGVEGHLWSNMTSSTLVTATGDISMHVHGYRSITATGTVVNLLRTQGRCTIAAPTGLLTLDGDVKVTGALLHFERYFPNLQNILALDAAIGFAGGSSSYDGGAYGATGNFVWDNVTAENCTDVGWSLREQAGSDISAATSANPIVMTAANHGFTTGRRAKFINFKGDFAALNETTQVITVLSANTFSVPVNGAGFAAWASPGNVSQRTTHGVLRHCNTRGTTGSGNFAASGRGFLFHAAGLDHYERIGGDFKGDAAADSTDGFKCNRVSVANGWHDKVGRGPTVGFESQLVTVAGTATSESAGNGVSLDTTTGVGTDETTTIGAVVGNVVSRAARMGRTTGSHISYVGNRGYKLTGGGFAGNGNGRNLFYGDNATDLEDPVNDIDVSLSENTRAEVGVNSYTSSSRIALASGTLGATNLLTMLVSAGYTRTATSNMDLRATDRVIYLDTTSGTVDIDLFDRSEVKATGMEVFVIWKAGVNNATITFQGGAANGETINGATTIVLFPSQQFQGYRVLCVDGETGTWVAQPAGLNFIQSASVTWNPANLASSGAPETTTIAVTGAIVGDFVELSFTQDLKGCVLFGRVTAADVVTAYLVNATGGAQDVANGTVRALVWRKQG